MRNYYAGIGSRSTPPEILFNMTCLAKTLAKIGMILRSGGAPGADLAFEKGAGDSCEIFLPSPSFSPSNSRIHSYSEPTYKAMEMASKHHPVWRSLNPFTQKLHARNCHQILGYNLDHPSRFVICWTEDGCESDNTRTRKTGGTGMAISIASEYEIPIFNLRNDGRYEDLLEFLAMYYYNINT
jgi:hypothetical protein